RAYLVEMPHRYTPNLEMSMLLSTFDLPRGSSVAFVRDEAYPPDFTPWGLQNFDTGIAWTMIDPEELNQVDLRPVCATDCRIFYTRPYAGPVEARLGQVFGAGTVTPYTNQAGDVVGYAYSPIGQP
ncbi:MAG: hypothetical protein ACRDGG_00355, partial [Anaerolineae bacterium]